MIFTNGSVNAAPENPIHITSFFNYLNNNQLVGSEIGLKAFRKFKPRTQQLNTTFKISYFMKYKFLDHTADVMFEAYGKNLDELFTNCALALQEIQVELKTVNPTDKHTFKISNKELDKLLFDFLQELVYLKDAEEVIFSKFEVKITQNDGYNLKANCYGEKISLKKHTFNVDAKAITMHRFEVKKEKNWIARVIVDI